uniref:Uncharacterized protein n=1 Tax=Oryza glumipatula TaxID=40148 RepID=A0A0D9YTV0_9ORYZ
MPRPKQNAQSSSILHRAEDRLSTAPPFPFIIIAASRAPAPPRILAASKSSEPKKKKKNLTTNKTKNKKLPPLARQGPNPRGDREEEQGGVRDWRCADRRRGRGEMRRRRKQLLWVGPSSSNPGSSINMKKNHGPKVQTASLAQLSYVHSCGNTNVPCTMSWLHKADTHYTASPRARGAEDYGSPRSSSLAWHRAATQTPPSSPRSSSPPRSSPRGAAPSSSPSAIAQTPPPETRSSPSTAGAVVFPIGHG